MADIFPDRTKGKRRYGNDDPMSHEQRREQYLERPLPSSEEAERVILGTILLDNELVTQAVETLLAEDFYSPLNRRVFAAMQALFSAQKSIDYILIGEELKKEGSLESIGGATTIANLAHGLPYTNDLSEYIQVVKDKSTVRKLIRACNAITSEALAEESDTRELLDNAERQIFEVCEQPANTKPQTAGELAYLDLTEKERLRREGVTVTGIPTGLKDLDSMLGGVKAPDLLIVAGRPSMGKTALGLQLAKRASANERVVAVFSLEMSKQQLIARLLCTEAGVSLFRYNKAFIHDQEWTRLMEAYEFEFKQAGIYIDDEPGISPMQMMAKSRRIFAERKRLDLIIVDYLQLMSGGSRRSESRQQEVSQISRELKAVAKLLNVPVIAVSQLSRGPEARNPPIPIMSDLRESGAIEQDADIVMFLYREDYYNEHSERRGQADIIIAKHRNGPTGTVATTFLKEFTKFENLYAKD
jgi:replicative DNA helicase